MACFLVTAAEAVIVTAVSHAVKTKEEKNEVGHVEVEGVKFFPFLTAMSDPGDTAEMLHEMSTVGVTMALLVTGAWGVMVCAVDSMLKRALKMPRMTA